MTRLPMTQTRQGLIPITIDDRERAGPVPEALRENGGFNVTVTRLKTGDYLLDHRFLFERKTLPDFAASVISGRLFRQATKLVRKAAREDIHPVFILEGNAGSLDHSGIRREALQGALITVSLFMGLPVLRAQSADETVRIFRYVAQQGRATIHHALAKQGYRPKGKPALQSQMLQSFPGVGPAKARSLLNRFGTIRQVINADQAAWAQTPGIGDTIAGRMHWLIEEGGTEYRSVSI